MRGGEYPELDEIVARAASAPAASASDARGVIYTPWGYLLRSSHGRIQRDKDKLLKRLARIEGQVRGVSKMVEEERYCIDVLTQIGAIQAALDKVALGLIDDHTRHCVVEAEGGERVEKVDELMAALGRFVAPMSAVARRRSARASNSPS